MKINKNRTFTFYFFALAAHGKGISGGDRIFIEFARRWARWEKKICICVTAEGRNLTERQKLSNKNIKYQIISIGSFGNINFFVNYLIRIIEGIGLGITLKPSMAILYSCSDFLMDIFPAFINKMRNPKNIWIAAWYQTAPNPFKGFSEGEREDVYRINAFLYWFSQLIAKPLISNRADYVLVNNEEERKQFPKLDKKGKVIVVLGAVPLSDIKKYIKGIKLKPKLTYDAVFQGRFHAQKGVIELIDIWKNVVNKKPDAKLAMIGDGPLMKDVKKQIIKKELEKNVKLFGYVFDGPKKYLIFSKSKIVVHPAFYDSGGMAAAEAMAFGLPAVGFDLKAYSSYYPKGMVKVKTGNIEAFSNQITKLLDDDKYRKKLGNDALNMIENYWSWEKRAKEVLQKIR